MIWVRKGILLRLPEPEDAPDLYHQKNDPGIAVLLGGHSAGYSMPDILDWIESRRGSSDDLVWSIIDTDSGRCMGHAGLYRVDHRVGSAEFGILLGEASRWGQGIGGDVTRMVIRYGFTTLNLRRISLSVLETNTRAVTLYERVGFQHEGLLREAQYKEGEYRNLVLMGLLKKEFNER